MSSIVLYFVTAIVLFHDIIEQVEIAAFVYMFIDLVPIKTFQNMTCTLFLE